MKHHLPRALGLAVPLALLLQSLWPAALAGTQTCEILNASFLLDANYFLSFRELPRLEGPELFEQLAKGEVKLVEKGQVGLFQLFLRTLCLEEDRKH